MNGLHDMGKPPFVFAARAGRGEGFGLTPKLAKLAAVLASLSTRPFVARWASC